jgi:hypothetical protein
VPFGSTFWCVFEDPVNYGRGKEGGHAGHDAQYDGLKAG